MSEHHIEIIRYDCGWGCRDHGCEDGPYHLDEEALTDGLQALGHHVMWHDALHIREMAEHDFMKDKDTALPIVAEAVLRLARAAENAVLQGRIPVVIGGDHTAAIGTWSGIITAHDAFQEFGLVWLDAHLDAHTPETAHEGKWGGWWHGMPVACLAGEGVDELTRLSAPQTKIDMAHFSLIGARSYEPGEAEFMDRHNARFYKIPEVAERGFDDIFSTSLTRAATGTKGFGLSVDLDGFAPADAPGVGTNEKGGLSARDALAAFKGVSAHPLFRGIEVVEYNPHKDQDGKTARLINEILFAVFAPKTND